MSTNAPTRPSAHPAPIALGERVRKAARALYHLLGSMRFAVAILVIVALAACIGSIVPQNAGPAAYVSQYGTTWTAVLVFLGMTDVYHASWFGALLVVMSTSTAICVVRNTPAMLRQVFDRQDQVNRKFVETLPCRVRFRHDAGEAALLATLMPALRRERFRVATRRTADGALLVAARRGGARRVGYILTHAAIVLITVAAFLDSDLAVRGRVLAGLQQIETRDLPVDAVPPSSVLPAGTLSYRGQLTLAEGESASNAIVPIGDGYLVQPLPFTVRLHRFHIERYPNGQPRDFVSDLEIQLPGQPPTRHALRVNHPLAEHGVTLYQSGFADGGSTLNLRMLSRTGAAVPLAATVGSDVPLLIDNAPWTFQASDLRMDNIQDTGNAPAQGLLRRYLEGRSGTVADLGPTIEYVLRDPAGQPRTMVTYLRPLTFGGDRYFVSGVRRADGEGYEYIRVPVDADGSATTFERFERQLQDPAARQRAARRILAKPSAEMADVAARALEVFAHDGSPGIAALVEATVPEAERGAATTLLSGLVVRAARALAAEDDEQGPQDASARRRLQDLLNAHDDMVASDAPAWALAGTVSQRAASGLQVARRGGDALLIVSLSMLAIGVWLLYAVRERRLWLWWDPASRVAVAGLRANRKMPGLEAELAAWLAPLGPLPPVGAGNRDLSEPS